MNSVYLSLVIPVYNEEVNLTELVTRCRKTCADIGKSYEVVLVYFSDAAATEGYQILILII